METSKDSFYIGISRLIFINLFLFPSIFLFDKHCFFHICPIKTLFSHPCQRLCFSLFQAYKSQKINKTIFCDLFQALFPANH
ncbi:hypothetical protein HMPREF3293_01029 [Christensenella minuta]|uniref:Uncharacterized protein n=1 Tax=Christensenella minuta TaxID=626937 RepID=A0A136Q6M7_9FIRM|nr:hypothetical protein HMPREF3293_01029 [Christensenella minuta]